VIARRRRARDDVSGAHYADGVNRDGVQDEPVDRDATSSSDDIAKTRAPLDEYDEPGGDAACWAHLVCPKCGVVIEGEHSCASSDTVFQPTT
jgi:hypothetical protein